MKNRQQKKLVFLAYGFVALTAECKEESMARLM
jgi:hypothetical protein